MAPKLTREEIAAKLAKALGQPVRPYLGQGGRLLGEFPNDPDNGRGRARTYFLNIVARRNPDFVPSLMRLYQTWGFSTPMPTESELEAWAGNLAGTKWILDWARLALSQYEGSWGLKELFPTLGGLVTFDPPTPEAWRPHKTTSRSYLAYIKDYMAATKELAIAAGMTTKPKPLQKHEPLHFEWLVRFQVEGESQASIAKNPGEGYEYSGERSAINNAIHDLAKDIGLTLRK